MKKLLILITILLFSFIGCNDDNSTIKVGILHSLSGTMKDSEKPVLDATLLAISEINDKGGVLGKIVEPIIVDGKSDWPTFAKESENLITQEKVSVVFGCWTSASRKTVKPIFERYDHLLFYPVQYEGLESSPNIIYTGAAPNQQIIPAVKWASEYLGKRFFLVSSDYIFPRMANSIIHSQMKEIGGEIVGEEYALLGSQDVNNMINKIIETKPDVILNTINGSTNEVFFKELRNAGITSGSIPVLSFSIAEQELTSMQIDGVGDYACWNYFQSLDNPENSIFVEKFKDRYGVDRVVTDPMEAAYFGVHLWEQAVIEAGTEETRKVRESIVNQSFSAPEGLVKIDPENNHVWKNVRIAKILKDGQFEVLWGSNNPIKPVPYPNYKSNNDWNKELMSFYYNWDENWANIEKVIATKE